MSENLPPYLILSKDVNADLKLAIDLLKPDRVAVLVDENTETYCLPKIDVSYDLCIKIASGEQNKTLHTCQEIWRQLTHAGCSRKSLLINLGGGVIGDMGGFAAATFKRGMRFINIPTTLLSMVDASIGGKLGVDFEGLKNHIGIFQEPQRVIIDTQFLKTLPPRELKSGYAEVIKHALIKDPAQWDLLQSLAFEEIPWEEIIPSSIAIKNEIVRQDPFENGLRKILNYGHTLGHALETYFLKLDTPMLHGEAVAWGMILENKIANRLGMLKEDAAERIEKYLRNLFDLPKTKPDLHDLMPLLIQDKKNTHEGLHFSLLKKEGVCTYDVRVDASTIEEVFR